MLKNVPIKSSVERKAYLSLPYKLIFDTYFTEILWSQDVNQNYLGVYHITEEYLLYHKENVKRWENFEVYSG